MSRLEIEMGEESLKRYTDCVYFLASPFTCKKGIECEYRHSEIARLNPRDCWYWLAGSCLNPSCTFRHPQLNIHTKLSQHAPSQDQHCTSMKKVEVPCFFYFSGFCKKGDKCSFLHGTNDALKVLKTAPAISDTPQLENKTSAGSNTVPAVNKALPISSEAPLKPSAGSQVKPKEDVNPPDFNGQSVSPHRSTFKFEEAPAARLSTILDGEGSTESESVMYTDQSLEEQVDIRLREDYWLESSPGFDVLVGDRSKNLGYEDDSEYLVGIERDGGEVNDHFLEYDYVDCTEYGGTLCEEQRIDYCLEFDDDIDEQIFTTLRRISRYDDEKVNTNSIRKTKFLPVSLPIGGHRGVDQRSYLGKRSAIDDSRLSCFSERNNSSLIMYDRCEKIRQCGRQRYRTGKLGENKHGFKATRSSGQFRKLHPNISRQQYKKKRHSKRPVYSSDVSTRPVTRKRVNKEYYAFSGPKTLDQIKEEKRRGTRNGDSYGKFLRFSKKSEDFQGPKPFSEILKNKRKLNSIVDVDNGIS